MHTVQLLKQQYRVVQSILQEGTLQAPASVLQILLQGKLSLSSTVYLFCLVYLVY